MLNDIQTEKHKDDESLIKFGWAYGHYWGKCRKCGGEFVGSKRSPSCLSCAIAAREAYELDQIWQHEVLESTVAIFYEGGFKP